MEGLERPKSSQSAADLEQKRSRATNVQHRSDCVPRCELPFMPTDVDGVDRIAVVVQVFFIEAAATTVLHVGCTGPRSRGSAKRKGPWMLGERALTTR